MFLFTLSTLINVQEVRGETQVRINKSTEYDKRTTDINKFTGHDCNYFWEQNNNSLHTNLSESTLVLFFLNSIRKNIRNSVL